MSRHISQKADAMTGERRWKILISAPHNANAGLLAAKRVHSNSIRNQLQVLGAAT
jgi:hypothetical protein